jgi:hypothetical protein
MRLDSGRQARYNKIKKETTMKRKKFQPQFDTLDNRQLLTFATIDLVTGVLTPTPLVTGAQQEAALAIVNKLDSVVAYEAQGVDPWWAHLNPLDPETIPSLLGLVGLSDPFGPTEVIAMPSYNPPPVIPSYLPPFPWQGIDPPPVGYDPYSGQIEPMVWIKWHNQNTGKPIYPNEPN